MRVRERLRHIADPETWLAGEARRVLAHSSCLTEFDAPLPKQFGFSGCPPAATGTAASASAAMANKPQIFLFMTLPWLNN